MGLLFSCAIVTTKCVGPIDRFDKLSADDE